jgi:hypothetical protein
LSIFDGNLFIISAEAGGCHTKWMKREREKEEKKNCRDKLFEFFISLALAALQWRERPLQGGRASTGNRVFFFISRFNNTTTFTGARVVTAFLRKISISRVLKPEGDDLSLGT